MVCETCAKWSQFGAVSETQALLYILVLLIEVVILIKMGIKL